MDHAERNSSFWTDTDRAAANHAEDRPVKQVVIVDRLSQGPTVTKEQRFLVCKSRDAGSNMEPMGCCGHGCQTCRCPPRGLLASLITKVSMAAVLFGVIWSITEKECLPGGSLFGLVVLFLSAITGGKLVSLLKLPNLPPLPPLLGMLLAGVLLRNIPVVTDYILIQPQWSASLRNVALAVILARAGLGLDGSALRKLKAVCVRVAVGPCLVEASTVAVVSHFLMGLPWIWGFILGFVLGAVSPAVVVPSMLLLQKQGYGTEQGIPTLLMAAGSFDDILAITGFTTCLGVAFATGSTWYNVLMGFLEVVGGMAVGVVLGFFIRFFPNQDQKDLTVKRSFLVLGLSIFAVFASGVAGFSGSGGLCTLVLAFLAGMGWGESKATVEDVVGRVWDIFQPLLFGLIGTEISISSLDPATVGLSMAALCIGLFVRILFTFVMVLFAGFSFKEKVFISLAWLPKATVQAAIGSTALDMARKRRDEKLERHGIDVLTTAVLSILVTAPLGALLIGLTGPRLLSKPKYPAWTAVPPDETFTTDQSTVAHEPPPTLPMTYESSI